MPVRRLLPVLLVATGCGHAAAADLGPEEPQAPYVEPASPGDGWSGFYVGLQAGAAFNRKAGEFDYDPASGAVFPATAFSSNSDKDGDFAFIGGGHIGYDRQIGAFIVGAVADINYLDAGARSSFTLGTAAAGFDTYDADEDINFVATARGKLGVAFDRFAVYGTGGLAYADTKVKFSAPDTAVSTSGYVTDVDSKHDDFGFAVGAGVDYLVTRNISFGLEYLYTDLGKSKLDVTYTNPASGADTSFEASSESDLAYHSVFAKASYRFD